MVFAGVNPIVTGLQHGWRSGMSDGFMYAEALATTAFITDVTKIAVRRPRPLDYRNPPSEDTDAVLSYFSGPASMTAAAASTATYLAFVRSPHTIRAWLTLGVGTALTARQPRARAPAATSPPT
jgi:hypothetical protein